MSLARTIFSFQKARYGLEIKTRVARYVKLLQSGELKQLLRKLIPSSHIHTRDARA